MSGDREASAARLAAALAYPELAAVADRLDRKRGWWLPLPPTADILGAAVFWLDEVILTDPYVVSALRPVLRYRTTLARGQPDVELEGHWEAAKLLFPNWVGFRPRRRRWTRRFASAYRWMELRTDEVIAEMEREEEEGRRGLLSRPDPHLELLERLLDGLDDLFDDKVDANEVHAHLVAVLDQVRETHHARVLEAAEQGLRVVAAEPTRAGRRKAALDVSPTLA